MCQNWKSNRICITIERVLESDSRGAVTAVSVPFEVREITTARTTKLTGSKDLTGSKVVAP